MKKAIPFLLPVILLACKKESNNSQQDQSENFYFKGTINGVPITWSLDNSSEFTASAISDDGKLNDCTGSLCGIYDEGSNIVLHKLPALSSEVSMGIFYSMSVNGGEDRSGIKSYLEPGPKSFGSERMYVMDPVQNGFIIDYADETGKGWGSDLKSGSQEGSSFQSISLEDAPSGKTYSKIWNAKFSCKLYSNHCDPGVPPDIINIEGEIRTPVFRTIN
jgi:hypothetical protein